MSERLKGRDIPIVQPVYGSPVKPILTSDDKPQIKPIPIPKPGQGNTIDYGFEGLDM